MFCPSIPVNRGRGRVTEALGRFSWGMTASVTGAGFTGFSRAQEARETHEDPISDQIGRGSPPPPKRKFRRKRKIKIKIKSHVGARSEPQSQEESCRGEKRQLGKARTQRSAEFAGGLIAYPGGSPSETRLLHGPCACFSPSLLASRLPFPRSTQWRQPRHSGGDPMSGFPARCAGSPPRRWECADASASGRVDPGAQDRSGNRSRPGGRIRDPGPSSALEETPHLDLTRLEGESGFGLHFDPILGVAVQGF